MIAITAVIARRPARLVEDAAAAAAALTTVAHAARPCCGG